MPPPPPPPLALSPRQQQLPQQLPVPNVPSPIGFGIARTESFEAVKIQQASQQSLSQQQQQHLSV